MWKRKCEICNSDIPVNGFGRHIKQKHNISSKKYYDKYLKQKDEGLCENCNNETKFIKISQGYRRFCSQKCSALSKSSREKARETYFKKTGYYHNTQNPKYRQEIEKQNIKRYGKKYIFQTDKFKNNNKKLYNDKKWKSICERRANTQKENEKYKRKERLNKIGTDNNFIVIDCYDKQYYNLHCTLCNTDFEITDQLFRIRKNKNETICTNCNKVGYISSNKEKELYEFIKAKCEYEVKYNIRNIIGLELDIYIPELKLAFEFNGLYWHNELNKPKDYHLNKTKLCEEKGIQLIHIYEDDWNYKSDIVKSRILNLLGKSKRIYARKTEVRELFGNVTRDFLVKNHIQGNVNSKYRYGLFYDGELVSVMTFGKSRFKDKNIEMHRFCNKLGYQVVGGAGKLFKHFIRQHKPSSVISYADRSWSTGKLYYSLGFKKISETKPNYYYVLNKIRNNRFNFRKTKLIKEGFDKNKSEHDIMSDRGIFRIYDSGNLKFEFQQT